MGYETDKRFNAARFRGFPDPRKISAVGQQSDGKSAASETSQKFHDEAGAKNAYSHGVVTETSPWARRV